MAAVEPDDYDALVVDAEPFVAYFLDEPGASGVERLLTAVEDGALDGYVSDVTLAEVLYVCARASDRETAEAYVDAILDSGFDRSSGDRYWRVAGRYKIDHTVAIGDAFALATAAVLDSDGAGDVCLLVGAADDFDGFAGLGGEDGPTVVQFRDDAA